MYKCKQCGIHFEREAGIKYKSGKHIRLDCPVCKSFVRFLQQPIPDAGHEIMAFGKYKGKAIYEIFAIDSNYILWLTGVKGRPGRVAQSYLGMEDYDTSNTLTKAEILAIEADGQQTLF